jgi:hypothetical protein
MWVYLRVRQRESHGVLIFNDGAWYLNRKDPSRTTHIFDVLHSIAEFEPTIAIFIRPDYPHKLVQPPV